MVSARGQSLSRDGQGPDLRGFSRGSSLQPGDSAPVNVFGVSTGYSIQSAAGRFRLGPQFHQSLGNPSLSWVPLRAPSGRAGASPPPRPAAAGTGGGTGGQSARERAPAAPWEDGSQDVPRVCWGRCVSPQRRLLLTSPLGAWAKLPAEQKTPSAERFGNSPSVWLRASRRPLGRLPSNFQV